MAIFVGRKELRWVAEAARNLENWLQIGFEAKNDQKGAAYIVAKDDCEPREALEQINAALGSLPGASSDFVRPLFLWREGSEPVSIAEAYVTLFNAQTDSDWTPTHPMSLGLAPPERE